MFKQLFYLSLGLALTLSSCKKKSDDPAPATQSATVTGQSSVKADYEKRWNLSSNSGLRQSDRSVAVVPSISFVEFNFGTYFIGFSDGSTKTGSYTESTKNSLTLNELGKFDFSITTSDSLTFSLTLDGTNTKKDYKSGEAPKVAASSMTTKLCCTWKCTELPADDQDSTVSYFCATFSQYGTYLVKTVNKDGSVEYGTNTWKWSDADEKTICYGGFDGGLLNCTTAGKADISITVANRLDLVDHSEPGSGLNSKYVLMAQ
jgi:hypothetical protein